KGFAKANNQALAKAKGEYVLFLNPDTILPEDGLHICMEFFRSHPDAGALGVRMLDGKGQFLPESKRSFPSPWVSLYKLTGLSSLFPHSKIFGRYHLGYLNENENHAVEVLAGAFMMLRKSLLDKIGGFDEHFFMYGEDIDLSYRVQQTHQESSRQAWQNYYVSDTSILHFKGESTAKGTLNYVRMFYLAMSQFVQKHYSSSRAGLFSGLMRIAIWLRAGLTVCKQFIKQTGLPLIDGVLIWLMFWGAKTIWSNTVRTDIVHPPLLIIQSFTGFVLLFLLISYYTGLYQHKFRYKYLIQSGTAMLFFLLAIYALLPLEFRFSRAIVVMGSLLSVICLALWRTFLLRVGILESAIKEEERYTLVVGTKEQAASLEKMMLQFGKSAPLKGVVSPIAEPDTLGTMQDLKAIVKGMPVHELIFCEGPHLSFKQIIAYYREMPTGIKLRLHASGSESVIGSDSKFYSGEAIGAKQYRLSEPVYRRLKRLIDVAFALLFLLLLPIHFFTNRHPLRLLKNAWMVLIGSKTWIGYDGMPESELPSLPTAVLGPNGFASSLHTLQAAARRQANEWYAGEFDLLRDIYLIITHYKYLGIS
ncbi:MAG: glycosyltransferase, partial [Bacteroidetes bacterium]|nr:glycosyltransferase [Bacteroidota bacterium]